MMKGRKNLLLLDKRMVKHVSSVSKTTKTSRVYWLIVLKTATADELARLPLCCW